ncbi:MAG: magnesium/cobalt transporter CorA [Thermoanaerobaculales bacterium]|jgi:magnesium transporter|nr:magnesium/cobalt transporter CorA [Thermoanaerobaculales bacterium]
MRIVKGRHPPGTAPGTLPSQDAAAGPVRARIITFDAAEISDANLLDPEGLEAVRDGLSAWLDIEGHDVQLIAALGSRLEVHPLALEDVLHVGQRPKIEDYEESLFMVLDHFSTTADGDLEKEQISLVLQPGLVLSVRERASELFAPVRQRLEGGRGRIRTSGAGYLAYALIDTVIDHVFPVLEGIGDTLEELEASILENPTSDDLGSLHEVKRRLLLLRKSMWPLRDMLRNHILLESPLFEPETRLFLRDAADHATIAVDIIETYREMVASLNDLYLTNISIRANEIMKVLTVIATIFIPLSFIAGVYGMNFDPAAGPWNMPELAWPWGYPMALAVMALVACGLVIFIWRRRWL